MFLFRLLVFVIFIYVVYKLIKNLFLEMSRENNQNSVKGTPEQGVPPPYDPHNVEDIEFKDIEKGHKKKS